MSEIPKRPEPPSSAADQGRRADLEALLGGDEPAGADGPDITLPRLDAGLLVEPAANGGAEPDGGEGGTPERGGLAGGGARGRAAANPGEWVGITRPSPRSSTPRFLTYAIVEMGFAAQGEVDDAIETARSAGTTPEKVLLEKGVLTGDSLSRVLAERYALEHLDLGTFHVDMTAANLVTTSSAKRYQAVPVAFIDKSTLLVAMADPANVLAVDDMAIMTGHEVRAAVASPEDIVVLISRLDRLEDVVGDPGSQLEEAEQEDELLDVREASQDAPAVKLVNQLVAQAVERGASDVHFAREGGELRVRFRVDGVLEDVTTVPRRMAGGVISRVKIMADLDIAERRLPQDGRVGLPVDGRRIDLRVVTLPSVQGESVVIRVLDKEAAVVGLDQLGMAERERERFEGAFREANGAVLVTGPTGSGKSTTLYAALQALNTPEKNIITVEDPVEYEIAGITQIQISTRTGLTFATGLRAMVRADPDVIMVGEIRDHETARIAVESALTGHLVLSTLHTNDAPTAITRLIEMGIEPFLVASAIDCVVAQRLVRMLCSNCKRRAIIPASVLQNSGYKAVLDLEAYEPAGCRRCGGSGYRGRIGIYEVMTVSKEIQSMALERRPAEEIRDVAVRQGMRRLPDDGLDKVKQGRTSIAEIARVIGSS